MAVELKLLNSDGTISNIAQGGGVVMSLVEKEFSALTSEDVAQYYSDGVRAIFVDDSYVNLVPLSISQSGAIYNGSGYMNGYRLNSSGGIQSSNESVLTGFIPYTYGETIEIVGGLNPANSGGQYIATYDSSFNLIFVNYLSQLIPNSGGKSICTDENVYIHTIKTSSFASSTNANGFKNAAYIRVSIAPCIGRNLNIHYI